MNCLSQVYRQACREIELPVTEKVDPELIGGLMIRIGDKRYDGTIRKSLLEVKKNLMEKRFHN